MRFSADLTSLAHGGQQLEVPEWLDGEALLYCGAVLTTLTAAAFCAALWLMFRRGGGWRAVAVTALLSGSIIVAGTIGAVDAAPVGVTRLAVVASIWLLPVLLCVWALTHPRPLEAPGLLLRLGVAGAAICLALSLGPTIHAYGHPLGPGPYNLLLVAGGSFYAGARVPARIGGTAILFFALAGAAVLAGAAEALRSFRWRRPLLAIVYVACLLALLPEISFKRKGLEIVRFQNRPEYAWLRSKAGDVAFLELPEHAGRWNSSRYMLASKFHWIPMVNGVARLSPRLYWDLHEMTPWTDEFFRYVRSYLPIRYVVLHAQGLSEEQRRLFLPRLVSGELGWREVHAESGAHIFEVDRANERGEVADRVYLRSELHPSVTLRFAARALQIRADARTLVLRRDDEQVGRWRLDEKWNEIEIEITVADGGSSRADGLPAAVTLLRWELTDGGEFELRGISVSTPDEFP